jgi:hypothetical protein
MCIVNYSDSQINTENRLMTIKAKKTSDITDLIRHMQNRYPLVLKDKGDVRYLLIEELPDELDQWILTGKTDQSDFQVLSYEMASNLKIICRENGFKLTYGNQKMEYMHHTAEIEYPRIKDPSTGKSLAIIPWFLLPRKRYPAFVYMYACWSSKYEHKGDREATVATSALFGVPDFHFSTTWRSKTMMDTLLNTGDPISVEASDRLTINDIFANLPNLMNSDIQAVKCLPSDTPAALANIPKLFAQIVRPKAKPIPTDPNTRRKRPNGKHRKGKHEKKKIELNMSNTELHDLQQQFITLSKNLILNAAIEYHKFIL